MPCIRIPNGIACLGGPIHYVEHRGRKHYFEFHSYLGPMPCTKDGDDRKTPSPEVVWDAICEQYKEWKAADANHHTPQK